MLCLKERVIRKLKRIRAKYIPKNIVYRPIGYYKNIDDYISHEEPLESKEVYPAHYSKLNISEEFFFRHTSKWALGSNISPVRILKIKNGRIITNTINLAVVSENNKLIGGVSYEGGKKIQHHSVLSQKYFNHPKLYKGVAFSLLIGGAGLDNYFHWFFDLLPKFHLLKRAGWFDEVDWFILPSYNRPYQKETLRALGIDEKKIIQGDKVTHLQVEQLIVTSFIRTAQHIPVWACEFLKDFSSKIPTIQTQDSHPYIYVSREDAKYRNVINEPALFAALEKYGFKKIELGKLTFREQVNLFASAKVIVSPHGAGLTNLVFCKKGTAILELFSKDYIIYLFYDLALKMGLHYEFLFCDSNTNPVTLAKRIQQNLIVDVEKALEKLEKFIKISPNEEVEEKHVLEPLEQKIDTNFND